MSVNAVRCRHQPLYHCALFPTSIVTHSDIPTIIIQLHYNLLYYPFRPLSDSDTYTIHRPCFRSWLPQMWPIAIAVLVVNQLIRIAIIIHSPPFSRVPGDSIASLGLDIVETITRNYKNRTGDTNSNNAVQVPG